MRTTIVPAQITTVEDKIAGNLTLTQIFLLLTPIFFGSIIYLIFPPQLHFAIYKLPIIAFVFLVCCTLAIRIKGKVIIQWLVILLRYNNRPRYFVANKNDTYQRDILFEIPQETETLQQAKVKQEAERILISPKISLADRVKLEHVLPLANMRILFGKKGGMHLVLTQVKK